MALPLSVSEKPGAARIPFVFVVDRAETKYAFFAAFTAGKQVFCDGQLRLNDWIPDLVTVEAQRGRTILRLIEAEPTAESAKQAARKYIPESPRSVVEQFKMYLGRLRAFYRRSFDSVREQLIVALQEELAHADPEVRTAAAIRSGTDCIEEYRLEGQGLPITVLTDSSKSASWLDFDGLANLPRVETILLNRAVLLADAVLLGDDRGTGGVTSWIKKRGEKIRVEMPTQDPESSALGKLMWSTKCQGVQVALDSLMLELRDRWVSKTGRAIEPAGVSVVVRALVERLQLRGVELVRLGQREDRVQDLLGEARTVVAGLEGKPKR
jgi:hypothetical protein